MKKLLACPFCGSEDVKAHRLIDKKDNKPVNYIHCNSCNAQSIFRKGECMDELIEIWNKRE